MTIAAISALLDEAVGRGDPPAAAACVIGDAILHESAHGASIESVFDVASVTKVAATTLAIAMLVRDGEVALDAPASTWIPWKGDATVRELLGHRSGLPAWRPFFATAPTRDAMLAALFATPAGEPGHRVYSDLGFMMLGAIVEKASGEALDAFVSRAIYAPLEIADIGFAGTWLEGRHVLPTGKTRPREPAPGQEHLYEVPPQPLCDRAGEVDDDNAFALGGVAGHAGLFGTARAIASIGAAILAELEDRGPLDLGAVLREFAAVDPATGPLRGLGFDHPASGGSVGAHFGPRAIGHLGFTGCSLWIDLDRRISAALLTNRTYPGRARVDGIRALRPAFHDAIVLGSR